MNSDMRLRGCGTALVTPFNSDDSVDYAAFSTLLDMQVAAGINFLVPLGTTAETPCLDDSEKTRLLEMTKEKSGGVPVIAGAGTNSLKATLRNIALLDSHGADGFLVVVPFYNKPTQQGMYEYFKAVAESTDKPIVLYNVPGRTGVNMLAETTLRLAEIDNIVAVKEASGNYAQISQILRNRPAGFSVLSGNDDEVLSLMATGADGVISVASNIVPSLMVELVRALLRNDIVAARTLHYRLMPLFKNCFIESNPIPVKAALHIMGIMGKEMRLPLTAASENTMNLMRETLAGLGLVK